MLVFISDIHLTDGTSGETINAGAFKKFTQYLEDLILTAKAKNVKVVLLGDIFDVIRSEHWLQSNMIRPWSKPHEKDGKDHSLKDYTEKIVDKICKNKKNIASMAHLKTFKNSMNDKDIEVSYVYITGNHDWLINRYSSTRMQVAKFLGMDDHKQYEEKRFPLEGFWSDYNVFARHGDIYDPFNYDGDRDASSLGDAIVIDLINKFPDAVKNDIGAATDPVLIKRLREVDNVRPLLDIPVWIEGVCRMADPEIAMRVKKVWDDLVDDFLSIKFVKSHDKFLWPDIVDALEAGLKISKYFSFADVASVPTKMLQYFKRSEYNVKAYHENQMRRNNAEFVLYGHTHDYKVEPLDLLLKDDKVLNKTYMNTGTWRRTHKKTTFDVKNMEFSSWDVMTFIAFYLKEEREDRKFEIWNGALG